jgi:hypothetical protein
VGYSSTEGARMSGDDILLREAVTLDDVMREVEALRELVEAYRESVEPKPFRIEVTAIGATDQLARG